MLVLKLNHVNKGPLGWADCPHDTFIVPTKITPWIISTYIQGISQY